MSADADNSVNVSLAARHYIGAGFVLVAFDRGANGKGPQHRGWNRIENCIRTVEAASNLYGNIGLCHAYSRTACIDIDDMVRAVEWFGGVGIGLQAMWEAPHAVRITSGRPNRGKLLYRLPPNVAPLVTRMFKGEGVELRCATASGLSVQDVLPPSIHPMTGKPYQWLGPGTYRDLPDMPADLLTFWRALSEPKTTTSAGGVAPIGAGREDIAAMLAKIDPALLDYDSWLHVGMALHFETQGNWVGLELWDAWSARDTRPPPKGYPGSEILSSKWQGFHLDHPKPRTLRSIAMMTGTDDFSSEYEVVADTNIVSLHDGNGSALIDFTTLATSPPKPRRWVRNGWIPRGKLKLMAGAGGIGKSLLEQQLQTVVANDLPWLGIPGIQGPTLGFYCEDDEDELMWRQAQIFAAYGLDAAKHSAGINVQSRVGKDNLLFTFDKQHRLIPTAFYHEMHAMLVSIRPVLLVLDNSAQMYNGSEIDRPMVTAFCNKLSGLALEFDMAVSLASHPAKVEDSEYSGSTAWDAAVRTRLYLQRKDSDTLTLKKAKANYAKREEMDLEYRNGIFVARTVADVSQVVASAEPLILAALEHFTRIQTNTSNGATAQNNLVKLALRDGLLNGTSETHAYKALTRLIASGEIRQHVTMPWRGADRHHPIGLATAAAALIAEAVEAAKVAPKASR